MARAATRAGRSEYHVTELRNARNRIAELEGSCVAQRSELERLKHQNEELGVRLHSHELQRSTLSNQYRNDLEQKEKEVKSLKQQLVELTQHSTDLSAFSTAAQPSNSVITSVDLHSDEELFGDIISSQHEINSLRGDVRRLTSEMQHWRSLAADANSRISTETVDSDADEFTSNVSQLQATIQELKVQLANTVDHHQHELLTLQDKHRQALSALKSNYSVTVDQLKKQIDAVELQRAREDLRQMESVRRKLESDLEHTHAADRKKGDMIRDLTEQLGNARLEIEQLTEQSRILREEKKELMGSVHELSDERISLRSEISALKRQCQEHEQEVHSLRLNLKELKDQEIGTDLMQTASSHLDDSSLQMSTTERIQVMSGDDTDLTTRLHTSNANYEELTAQNRQFDEQVRKLRSRIESYELEMEQFELVKADWEMEKETLEEVLLKLRSELREKEEILSIIQAQKDFNPRLNACSTPKKKLAANQRQGLIEAAQGQGKIDFTHGDHTNENLSDEEEDADVKTQADRLDRQVELLASGSAMLEDERDQLVAENASLLLVIDEQRHLVASLQAKLDRSSEDIRRFSEQTDANNSVNVEPEKNSNDNEGVQTLMTLKHLDDPSTSFELPRPLQPHSELIQPSTADFDKLREENHSLKSELDQVRSEWRTEKKKLERSLDELDAEHRTTISELVEDREKLVKEIDGLKNRFLNFHSSQSDENELAGLSRAVATQAAEVARLSEVARVQALEISHLRQECDERERDLKSRCESMNQQHNLLEAQQHELERLRASLVLRQEEHSELVRQVESVRASEVTALQSLEASSRTNDDLQQVIANFKTRQTKLETDVGNLSKERMALVADLTGLKEELRMSTEARKEYELVDQSEVAALRVENRSLKQNLDEMESVSKLYEAEVERLTAVEERQNNEVQKLNNELNKFREVLSMNQEGALNHSSAGVGKLEDHSPSAAEVENLRASLVEKESALENLRAKNREMEEKLSKLNCEVTSLKELLRDRPAVDNFSPVSDAVVHSAPAENGVTKNHSIPSSPARVVEKIQPGLNSSELSRLHSTIAHQNDLIDTLNSKYTSLLTLLDDRSRSVHGSSILVEMHQLESEARELRADRERLVTVLGEKTRESGALRGEVHRLTAATAATQAALAKTQLEARSLAQGNANGPREINQDMKNEAVKRLSQIVRDKDVEIEALKMKNATLVQVLQDSAPDGSKVSSLFGEADDLRSQLAVYQRDREQLINGLTSKHQESVRFYEEAQRLSSRVSELGVELEQRAQAYNSLNQQYEEKQRALYSALSELSTLRQRRTELERQLASRAAKSPDNGSRISFSLDSEGENDDESSAPPTTNNFSAELRQYKDAVVEKELAINERDQRIVQLEQAISDRERLMAERQQEFIDGAAKLRQQEDVISARTSELTALRKQCDVLAFDLQGAVVERSELGSERDALRWTSESFALELQSLRRQFDELVAASEKKDYELGSMNARVVSLEKVVESAGRGEQHDGEVKMLMAQLDGLRQQMETLRGERDVSCQELRQRQAECIELRNKVAILLDREQRLLKECDRLRGHLVQIEEGYTREALEAEDREKKLRNRLMAAEERLMSSSSTIQNVRLDSAKQVESLQIQLHAIAEQRDNALFQLSSAQETVTSYASSLANLQMVLEQFQAERQQQQILEIERYRRDAQREHDDAEVVRQEMRAMQKQLDEASDTLEAAHRLSEQLDRKESMIAALREEVNLREAQLLKAEEQVRKLTSSSDAKIDKIIIKNLLLGYFHTPPTKRPEALQVIGHILSYSREEMKEITSLNNKGSESSWIGGLFRKKSSAANPGYSSGGGNVSGNPYSSFSELFVKFLEQESTPQPSLGAAPRLPAERMIQEQQERQQRRSTPAFNPFSAAVLNSATPSLLTASGTGVVSTALPMDQHPQHPLMRPISPPRLPLFSTVSSDSVNAFDVTLNGSGRESADSSGRSTPASGILRDLLAQR